MLLNLEDVSKSTTRANKSLYLSAVRSLKERRAEDAKLGILVRPGFEVPLCKSRESSSSRDSWPWHNALTSSELGDEPTSDKMRRLA